MEVSASIILYWILFGPISIWKVSFEECRTLLHSNQIANVGRSFKSCFRIWTGLMFLIQKQADMVLYRAIVFSIQDGIRKNMTVIRSEIWFLRCHQHRVQLKRLIRSETQHVPETSEQTDVLWYSCLVLKLWPPLISSQTRINARSNALYVINEWNYMRHG